MVGWLVGAFVVLPLLAGGASVLLLGVTTGSLLAAVVGVVALGLAYITGQWVIDKG